MRTLVVVLDYYFCHYNCCNQAEVGPIDASVTFDLGQPLSIKSDSHRVP